MSLRRGGTGRRSVRGLSEGDVGRGTLALRLRRGRPRGRPRRVCSAMTPAMRGRRQDSRGAPGDWRPRGRPAGARGDPAPFLSALACQGLPIHHVREFLSLATYDAGGRLRMAPLRGYQKGGGHRGRACTAAGGGPSSPSPPCKAGRASGRPCAIRKRCALIARR